MHARLGLAIAVVSLLPAGVGGRPDKLLALRNNQQELNYQLAHVAKNLRQLREMLSDTIALLNDPYRDQELIREVASIRLEQIQKSLKKNGQTISQAQRACKWILDNDLKGKPDEREDFSREVFRPLLELGDSKIGGLAQAEKAMQNLFNALNNQKPEAVPSKAKDGREKINQLVKRIDYLIYVTDTDSCNRLANDLVEIEREQSILSKRLLDFCQSNIGGPFRGLIDE
jgi:hypothetical protein